MLITDIKVISKTIHYKEKVKLLRATHDETIGCFIKIQTDEGIEGIGYAHGLGPVVIGETPESIEAIIDRVICPLLVGEDPTNIDMLLCHIDRAVRYNFRAKAGIDFALHDLVAKKLSIPLYQLLGGKSRSQIPVIRLVGISAPAKMAKTSLDLVAEGYRYLKLKIGTNPEEDLARVKSVREAVGDDIAIVADANQGYDVKTAIRTINKMSKYGLTLVEQPIAAFDFKGLATVRKNVDIPIEADESARSPEDVHRLIEMEAVDFISIKPPEVGGIKKAQKIAALCESANIRCVIGTTLGSQYVDAIHAHFIAANQNIFVANEIGEFQRFLDDPVQGFVIENGFAIVPEGKGVGVTIDV